MGADQMMCGWVEVRIVDMVVTTRSSQGHQAKLAAMPGLTAVVNCE